MSAERVVGLCCIGFFKRFYARYVLDFFVRDVPEGGGMTWYYECVGVVVATCWAVGLILFL